jgi:hypothetical protein
MLRITLNLVALLSLASIVSCTDPQAADNTVTGMFELLLKQQDATEFYVRYELHKDTPDSAASLIASSGFHRISKNPVHFSLSYPPDSVNQQSRYYFTTTVAKDEPGTIIVASMSSPVLTHGHPAVIHVAMQPMIAPVAGTK